MPVQEQDTVIPSKYAADIVAESAKALEERVIKSEPQGFFNNTRTLARAVHIDINHPRARAFGIPKRHCAPL